MEEGKAPFRLNDDVAETWYRIDGDLRPDDPDAPAPLVALHGGPGATHDYLLALADLAQDGRSVVFYDQIGNGLSSHYPERGADFWTVATVLPSGATTSHFTLASAEMFCELFKRVPM